MPWKNVSPIEQKQQFVSLLSSDQFMMSELWDEVLEFKLGSKEMRLEGRRVAVVSPGRTGKLGSWEAGDFGRCEDLVRRPVSRSPSKRYQTNCVREKFKQRYETTET